MDIVSSRYIFGYSGLKVKAKAKIINKITKNIKMKILSDFLVPLISNNLSRVFNLFNYGTYLFKQENYNLVEP